MKVVITEADVLRMGGLILLNQQEVKFNHLRVEGFDKRLLLIRLGMPVKTLALSPV